MKKNNPEKLKLEELERLFNDDIQLGIPKNKEKILKETVEKIEKLLKKIEIIQNINPLMYEDISLEKDMIEVEGILYTIAVLGLTETRGLLLMYHEDYFEDYFPLDNILEKYYNVDDRMEVAKKMFSKDSKYQIYMLAICEVFKKIKEEKSYNILNLSKMIVSLLGYLKIDNAFPFDTNVCGIEDDYQEKMVCLLNQLLD